MEITLMRKSTEWYERVSVITQRSVDRNHAHGDNTLEVNEPHTTTNTIEEYYGCMATDMATDMRADSEFGGE